MWPENADPILRPSIDTHGAAAVDRASLETLGYPAGWITDTVEAIAVATQLPHERSAACVLKSRKDQTPQSSALDRRILNPADTTSP